MNLKTGIDSIFHLCSRGYHGGPRRPRTCSPPQIQKYLSRVNGRLMV